MSRSAGRRADPARRAAYRVLRRVSDEDAYANLALAHEAAGLSPRDAAFATELTFGTCRALGTYDAILQAVSKRPLAELDPPVLDLLRLGSHQLLAMRVPQHAAVDSTVALAKAEVGPRITGFVNAVLRKVAGDSLAGWVDWLTADADPRDALALATQHPRWIVDAWADALGQPGEAELRAALEADNRAPVNHLVVRPGLAAVSELGGEPARYSPFGAYASGAPGGVPAVAEGRAGVQDEGSQLVALALSRVAAPSGPWLDLCAGPGGKAALLAGLAIEAGTRLVAGELQPHRARLVAQNLAGYATDANAPVALVADGTRPGWAPGSFAKVMADVPCSGLGALRRRPEARWRRQPSDIDDLAGLQIALLHSALAAAAPGGVVAYVTCSPHLDETRGVLATAGEAEILPAADYLPEVPDAAVGDFVQLWPHRHGTDAMFLALLRVGGG
ncbi:MAG: rRNA cytosine-C5-methylase [Actinobacteria bacterium]|nr:rRNA cytosine-C5-methylase [Actinomycetota bacterium]MCA0296309.1 rRNA cytosine-C5-methylase [Actinomycetota bacterium]